MAARKIKIAVIAYDCECRELAETRKAITSAVSRFTEALDEIGIHVDLVTVNDPIDPTDRR